MKKIKVACYCRVSTKKEEQVLSLENQRSIFEKYVNQQNMEIYKLYTDNGISGKSIEKRPGFQDMIEDAKKGLFSKILVKDISRFSRNTVDFLKVIRELKLFHVEVNFITANMTTYDSEFMLTMLAAVAQEESINTSNRVKSAKKISAQNGRVPGVVYGYDKIPGDKYGLKINEKEADVVKRIFKLYVEQQMSSHQIARLLNTELVPTKKGGNYHWSQTVVCNILKNPLYIGQVCNGKTETKDFITGERNKYSESEWIRVNRPEYSIISDELFLKANEIRKSRSNSYSQFEHDGKTKKRRVSIKYPLSNLLRCSNDNYSFRRKTRVYEPTGYEYTYWICSKRDYGVDSCNNKIKIGEKEMEDAIAKFLIQMFANRDVIVDKFKQKIDKVLQERYEKEYDITALKKEEKNLEAKIDKLTDLFIDSSLDKERLTKKIVPIQNRLNEIQKIMKIYNEKEEVSIDVEKCLSLLIDNIDGHLGNLLDNAFLKTIFDKFVIYPDGKIVAYIKIDKDTGKTIELPFIEVVDKKDIFVPEYTSNIQLFDRIKTAYRKLVW